ncbi:hypothetical protein [Hymenobacter cellulosivorans]|uniref:Uncharacterized protein n=1 Tax=Hymenobacter cellulosivorans TaxID=2932249 RepID=A0ABY4F9E4_9BACT|nr:hypothetical protein [Hymenobacter cellulosivorans]UOQ53059.1 hypothetical protein MUN80_25395 [Hymenobacter cellulosivorans]
MSQTVFVDRNKKVVITVERGAKDKHEIKISRKVDTLPVEVLQASTAVQNGPNKKLTFSYNAISEPATFILEPIYENDGWKPSDLKTKESYDGGNHLVFNFSDHNGSDDMFDLRVEFFMS